ncbi:MAG: hypothetical protein ABJE47_20150 [bacterium]
MANFVTNGRAVAWWTSAVEQWTVWSLVLFGIALVTGRLFPSRVERGVATASRLLLRPSSWTFAVAVGALACALSLHFGWRLFNLQPVVGDEFTQRWQAHVLAGGRLFARTQYPQEFFSTIETMDVNGRWFSQFPIGGPAMLSLGVVAGVPWLVNPLLAGVAAAALYLFVSAIGDELTARGTGILFALSPFVLFMAGSEMNHVSTLAFTMIGLAALPRWWAAQSRAGAMRTAAIIGGSLAIAATIRPFDAAVVGACIGAFQLWAVIKRRALLPSLAVQIAVGLVPLALMFLANNATLGQPFAFAYDVLNGVEHRPGFHMTPQGLEHTPRRGLYNISAYLMRLDVGLMGWPVPAMLVVVVALILQRRASAWDSMLLATVGVLLAGYTTYWSLSYFLGPRFLFAAVPVLLIYTARLPGAIRARTGNTTVRAAALLVIPLWLLVTWTIPGKTERLVGVKQLATLYGTRAMAPAIVAEVERAHLTNAVVFIPEGWHARLAARMRALTFRPLLAEQIVAQSDACSLQRVVDATDQIPPSDLPKRISLVVSTLRADPPANPLPNQLPSDQLSFDPTRELTTDCRIELGHSASYGVSLAELLPYQDYDANGDPSGNVIYARDFGARDGVLRGRFANRSFYVARIERTGDSLVVRLEPMP